MSEEQRFGFKIIYTRWNGTEYETSRECSSEEERKLNMYAVYERLRTSEALDSPRDWVRWRMVVVPDPVADTRPLIEVHTGPGMDDWAPVKEKSEIQFVVVIPVQVHSHSYGLMESKSREIRLRVKASSEQDAVEKVSLLLQRLVPSDWEWLP